MNKLKKTTKLKAGEYLLVKGDRSRWTLFTVLNPEMILSIKNENIDYACKEAITEAKRIAKEHNCELTENQKSEIVAEHEKMKFKFEDNLIFLPVDDALKQGIIQKVDNGYYMPTLDYHGVGIVNKINQIKHAKKKK